MAKQTQRVRDMVDNYVALWKEGYTPRQIAKHFQVEPITVYRYLQEIADKNGYSREELLAQPKHSGPKATCECPMRKEAVNAEQLHDDFTQAKQAITSLIKKIDLMEEETL